MTNWSQNVSTSVNVFAGTPSDLWNSGNWGTIKWGYGSNDLIQQLNHVLGDSLSPTDAIGSHSPVHVLAGSISLAEIVPSEILSDGSGWTYNFPSNVSNVINESNPSWASGTTGVQAWTSGVTGSTVWS